MLLADFRRCAAFLHRLTVDFVEAVPEDRWDYTPDVGGKFGSIARQVRHVVRIRCVYNDALVDKRVDWGRPRERYDGPLTRESLLAALEDQQARLLRILDSIDPDVEMDWGGGTMYTLPMFTWEYAQHEAIHHGQWSVYAQLGGFETPVSWQRSWKL